MVNTYIKVRKSKAGQQVATIPKEFDCEVGELLKIERTNLND